MTIMVASTKQKGIKIMAYSEIKSNNVLSMGNDSLFVSEDGSKYICTTGGSCCFMRGTHTAMAKNAGLDLQKMDNLTFAFYYKGKGKSIRGFLETY